MLDKLGVVPRFVHAGDFKTAPNTFTETKFTPEHRLQMETLMGSLYSQLIQAISVSRKIAEQQLKNMVEKEGPFTSGSAAENNLVDAALYKDELKQEIANVLGKECMQFRNNII